MMIPEITVKNFRDDLCKDQREIQINEDIRSRTGLCVRKYSTSLKEFKNEIDVMNFLEKDNIKNIPKILATGLDSVGAYLDIEYYNGIRVFNILAYIREMENKFPQYHNALFEFKKELLSKCHLNQIEIQRSLMRWKSTEENKAPYPQKKLFIIINMLLELYDIDLDQNKLNDEIAYVASEFEKISTVPFRDATTKNMVVYFPNLYLGNFIDKNTNTLEADNIRKNTFFEMIKDGSYKNILDSPIIDFDFSSCENLTSIYDDPIGFLCHEITFNGIPKPEDLIWIQYSNINKKDIALSFIIRYLRFGGRKMTYHIIHPHAYEYRFKYDNEFFYFEHLEQIIKFFWPDSTYEIPEFFKFINCILKSKRKNLFDDVDEFEEQYPECNRKFYLDIFPY